METPVLSQSERSKALSGNKPKQKKKSNKVRNVLASFTSPRTTSVTLTDRHSITFEELLKELFQYQPVKKPDWNVLKTMSKEERAALKKRAPNPLRDNHIVFGINKVTRLIEQQACVVVLITNDVNPPVLIKHIHEGCSAHRIPLFKIPDLRNIIRKCFGLPAMVVAFKEMLDEFHNIKVFFEEFCEEIQSKPNKNVNVAVDIEMEAPKKLQIKDNVMETKERAVTYLTRDDTKTRCFVPPPTPITITPVKDKPSVPQNNPLDFISFDSSERVYQNLKVKRLQPNPNRVKGKKKK